MKATCLILPPFPTANSVGKSTVLNAMLGDKYSEVSMRRTTAGVNFFRIHGNSDIASDPKAATWTHSEIQKSNARLRSAKNDELEEMFFDIEVDEPLLKETREDSKLVLVDIPGINEANSKSIYKDYVAEKWNTFDAVIVVMDAVQGVNTEEQVQLLEFVKENCNSKKDLAVFILCNKVDDPDDEEQIILVKEAQVKVEQIFGDECSRQGLTKLIDSASHGAGTPEAMATFKTFIPVSAMNAYIYRSASGLTQEKLQKFDKELIEKIGREEVGRFKWKKLSDDEKVAAVHSVLSDPESLKERMEATKFETFLSIFSRCLGRKDVQLEMIKKQQAVQLSLLSAETPFARDICLALKASSATGYAVEKISEAFWALFSSLQERILRDFAADFPANFDPAPLAILADELHLFYSAMDSKEEKKRILEAMGSVVKKELEVIIHRGSNWTFKYWFESATVPALVFGSTDSHSEFRRWKEEVASTVISPIDWNTILSSVLFAFQESDPTSAGLSIYKQEIFKLSLKFASLEYLTMTAQCLETKKEFERATVSQNFDFYQKATSRTLKDGVFVPSNPKDYEKIVRLTTPETLDDPSHWGHLTYKYLEMAKAYSSLD